MTHTKMKGQRGGFIIGNTTYVPDADGCVFVPKEHIEAATQHGYKAESKATLAKPLDPLAPEAVADTAAGTETEPDSDSGNVVAD
jgi:hypothetical protein